MSNHRLDGGPIANRSRRDQTQAQITTSNVEKVIQLQLPKNVSNPPTISLHLLVKNGEKVVERMLAPLYPYIREVVAVVNDTTDNTIERIMRLTAEHNTLCKIIPVTFASHPEFYILDEPETYQVGRGIVGETYEGPFTNEPLLGNWAAVRNLGWNACTSDWRLFLDVDECLEDPECLPSLCVWLESQRIELAISRYKYDVSADGKTLGEGARERLAKNFRSIVWQGKVHETLTGTNRRAYIEGSLVVSDRKDNPGHGVRVPGRDFKVMYHHARLHNWEVSARDLIYMAEAIKTVMPRPAAAMLDLYLQKSTWKEERAWACSLQGEILEGSKDYDMASEWYLKALQEFPQSSKAAFRLCRSKFHEQRWQAAIDAYELGIKNSATLQQLDGGEVFADASKIFAVVCLRRLGRMDEAIVMCEAALRAFPTSVPLQDMLRGLKGSKQ